MYDWLYLYANDGIKTNNNVTDDIMQVEGTQVKKMKKAWACAGSAALVLCCGFAGLATTSSTAFAAAADGTCSVDGTDTAYSAQLKIQFSDKESALARTFSAYKLASVTAVKTGSETGYKLATVEESEGALTMALVSAGKMEALSSSAVDVLGQLTSDDWTTSNSSDSTAYLRKTADLLKASTEEGLGTPVQLTKSEGGASAEVTPGIYYVVETTTRTSDGTQENASSAPMIIPTVLTSSEGGNCTFVGESVVKASQPTITQTVKADTAPSALLDGEVSFDLDFTVPVRTGYGRQNKYVYYIVETLPAGLTYKAGSAKIGQQAVEPTQDGQKLIWNFSDDKLISAQDLTLRPNGSIATYKDLLTGETAKLTYEATVNSKFVVGDTANTSTASLYFSNNVVDSTSLGKSENIVKTYQGKITINKKNNEGGNLTGSTFKVTASNGYDVTVADATDGANNDGKADAVLEFTGLKVDADGEVYKVEETQAPNGYARAAVFYVKATLNAEDGTITYQYVNQSGDSLGEETLPENVSALQVSDGVATLEVTDEKLLTALAKTGGNVALIVLGAAMLIGVSMAAGKARRARV